MSNLEQRIQHTYLRHIDTTTPRHRTKPMSILFALACTATAWAILAAFGAIVNTILRTKETK